MAVLGRKSKRRARTVNRPRPKDLSYVCLSFVPEHSSACQAPPSCFSKQSLNVHVSRRIYHRRTVNSHRHRHRLGSRSSMSTRRRSTLFDASPHTSRFDLRIIRFSPLVSSSTSVSANRARQISSPVIASSTRARHAAVCGLAVVFRRAAPHPGHPPV